MQNEQPQSKIGTSIFITVIWYHVAIIHLCWAPTICNYFSDIDWETYEQAFTHRRMGTP